MQVAWQAHFVTNMFIMPSIYELENFGTPDFVVMNGSKATHPDWKEHGLNSENIVLFNLTEKVQIIGGTWYGGDMKKGTGSNEGAAITKRFPSSVFVYWSKFLM